MDYKATNTNTHMILPLSKTCDSKPSVRGIGSLNEGNRDGNKETNFHGITIRPKGGLTDNQIRLITTQLIHDCSSEGLGVRASYGVEGNGQSRHIHIALVLQNRARHKGYGRENPDSKTWNRYAQLLEGTYDKTFCTKESNRAINVWQPGAALEDHMTQFSFLAYPLKTMARGTKGMAIIPDLDGPSTHKFASIGLFEGLTEAETEESKRLLSKAIKRAWTTKLESQKHICIDGSRKFWKKVFPAFYKEHCSDIANIETNRPEIIARMYQYADENKNYHFSDAFLRRAGSDVNLYLNQLEDPAEIHAAVVEYITIILEKIKPKSKKRKSTYQDDGALHEKIKRLKTELADAKSTIEEMNGRLAEAEKKTENAEAKMEQYHSALHRANNSCEYQKKETEKYKQQISKIRCGGSYR